MRNTTNLPSITHFKAKAKYYHLTKPELRTNTQALQYLARELGHESYQAIKPHLPLENSVMVDEIMIFSYTHQIEEIQKRFSHTFSKVLYALEDATLPLKGNIFISGRVGCGKTFLAKDMVYYDKRIKKAAYFGRKERFFETAIAERFGKIEYISLEGSPILHTQKSNTLHFYSEDDVERGGLDPEYLKGITKQLLEDGYSIILDELMIFNVELGEKCIKAILKTVKRYASDDTSFIFISQNPTPSYIKKFHSFFDTLLYFNLMEKPSIEGLDKAYSLRMNEGEYAVFERAVYKEDSIPGNAEFTCNTEVTYETYVRSLKRGRGDLLGYGDLVKELNRLFNEEDKPLMDMLNHLSDEVYYSFASSVIIKNNVWHSVCEQNNFYDEEDATYFKMRKEYFSELLADFSQLYPEYSSLHEDFLTRLLFYIDESRESDSNTLDISNRLDMLEFMQLSFIYNGGDIDKVENISPSVKHLYHEIKKHSKQ